MTVVGEAFVEIRPKDDDFAKDLDRDVSKAVSKADGKVPLVGQMDEGKTKGNVLGTVKGIAAAVGGAFVVKEVFDFARSSLDAIAESNAVAAQSAAVIKSTGSAAKVSAADVDALSAALSRKTGIDDEEIAKGENLLLTFTNIRNEAGKGNDVFNQSTQTLTDMAAALGGDVSSNAVQLGKALNDPTQGIAALSRVGVTFTEDQKKVIKTLQDSGDMAGAQKVILAELNKEFGGSAEAQATAGKKLAVTWGNIQEQLGAKLLPIFNSVAGWLADVLPGAIDTASSVLGNITRTIGYFVGIAKNAFSADDTFGGLGGIEGIFATVGKTVRDVTDGVRSFIYTLRSGFSEQDTATPIERIALIVRDTLLPAIGQIGGFIADNFEPILKGLVGVFILLTGPITAVVLTLAILYARFEVVREIVGAVAEFFISTFGKLRDFVEEVMPQIQEAIGHVMVVVQTIVETTLSAIRTVWSVVGDDVLRIVGAVFGQIKNTIEFAVNTIAGIIRLVLAVINGDWGKAWDAIKDIFGGVIDFVIGTLKSLGGILSGLLGAAFDAARRGIAIALPAILEFVGSIPGKIVDGLGALGSLLLQSGIDMIEGFIRGIRNTAGKIITAIREAITDKLPDFVKKALGIQSPSRVFEALGSQVAAGFAGGITGGQGAIDAAMNRLTTLPSIDPLIASATGTNPASGGSARGPAVWIERFEAREEADVDVLIRRTEFAVQSGTL